MIPIYFPYTYISATVAEAVSACFGRFAVYQPLPDKLPPSMQTLVEEGILDIRIPLEGGSRELVSAARNYQEWANAHAGRSGHHPVSLKTILASAPLPDDTLSSKIVADVKNQIKRESGGRTSDPVLAARIFLYFAQRFDQQIEELDQSLTEFSLKEQALIHELKMEDDVLAAEFNQESANRPDVDADYLIAERLEAWPRMLLNDPQPSTLFVTHSKAVLEQLFDRAPSAKKILDFDSIPRLAPAAASPASWQEQLFSYLSDIAKNKRVPDAEKDIDEFQVPVADDTVALKFYLVCGQNPLDFFCQATGIKGVEKDHRSPIISHKNTLLALVEI